MWNVHARGCAGGPLSTAAMCWTACVCNERMMCVQRVCICVGARRGRTRVEGEDAIDAGSRKRTLVDVADKVDQELERVARVVICQAGRQPLRQARGVVGDRAGVAEPGVVAVTVNAVAIVVKGALCLVEARGGVVAHVGEVERGGPPVLSGVCDDVGP